MTRAFRQIAPPPIAPDAPRFMLMTLRLRPSCDRRLTDDVPLLRHCVAAAQKEGGFDILAAVVLPEELRLLCRGALFERQLAGAARSVADGFARHGTAQGPVAWHPPALVVVPAHAVDAERDAVERAPVTAGLVKDAEDWPFSSVHRRRRALPLLGASVA